MSAKPELVSFYGNAAEMITERLKETRRVDDGRLIRSFTVAKAASPGSYILSIDLGSKDDSSVVVGRVRDGVFTVEQVTKYATVEEMKEVMKSMRRRHGVVL